MAVKGAIHGVDSAFENDPSLYNRDTRPLFLKAYVSLKNPFICAMFIVLLSIIGYVWVAFADILLVINLLIMYWALKQKEDAPLKIPIYSNTMSAKGEKSSGVMFIGNTFSGNKEIWLSMDDCKQHFLVIGTTGSGKTETLIGFVANALSWSSGFLYCDGKGDTQLFAKLFVLARRFGREDDLLVLNFMTGNRDVGNSSGGFLTNTLNPFSNGSSDALTQMVVSLMDDAGGDGAMWKGRATAMFTGVMRSLVWLRDQKILDLNVSTIREHISLKKIMSLAETPNMPDHIKVSLTTYLGSLPGFKPESKTQSGTTLDQHGFLEMQFTKILSNLADVYSHIFNTPNGDIDMYDVVLNRRILIVMLPALEKSPDETANIGKIIVATLKGMMGATLGNKIEGTYKEVVDDRITNSQSVYQVILDEVGYYCVEGMAVMAAQARSLNFSIVFASQDIPAMKKNNEKEAASIIANANSKFFMKTEEPQDTGKLAVDSGGKGYATRMKGYEVTTNEISQGFNESNNISVEYADRIEFRDLKSQSQGEFTMLFKGEIIRGNSFFANPPSVMNLETLYMRSNRFIMIGKPTKDDLVSFDKYPTILEKLLSNENIEAINTEAMRFTSNIIERCQVGDEIANAALAFDTMLTAKAGSYVEAGCMAVQKVLFEIENKANVFQSKNAQTTTTAFASNTSENKKTKPSIDIESLIDDIVDEDTHDKEINEKRDVSRNAFESAISDRSKNKNIFKEYLDEDDEDHPFQKKEREELSDVKKVNVRSDIAQGVFLQGRQLSSTEEVETTDAVLRMLADLDFDPENYTTSAVEDKLSHSIGELSDIKIDGDIVDASAYGVEKAIDSGGSSKSSDEMYLSNWLEELISEED